MGRRTSRNRKPTLEMVEQRELLSLITDFWPAITTPWSMLPRSRPCSTGVSNPVTTQAASASGQAATAQRSVPMAASRRRRNRSPCPRTRASFPPPAPVTTC